jgi:deoxyadenosine/deoxycytidine kinase
LVAVLVVDYFRFQGGPAVGKSSLCQELSRRGYRVHFELFVELCERHPSFRPGALVMSFKWANEMVARMEEFRAGTSRSAEPSLFFFDRSLLTPYVFARSHRDHLAFYVDLMHEVRSVFPCSVVLLKTESSTVKSRLLKRYDKSTPAEKEIRKNLNEMNDDWVTLINERYDDLFRQPGVIDFSLDTSSGTVEKCVDNLLSSIQKHT